MSPPDKPLRVLIAGGGVAGIELMLALRDLAEERVGIELLAPTSDFVYRPLAVGTPFGAPEPHRFSLERIAGDCGARHHDGALAGVDPHRRSALLHDGSEIAYDRLAVASGAIPRVAIPGSLTFRGEGDRSPFSNLLEAIEAGRASRVVFAVPGGVAWSLPVYELALMTAARCRLRELHVELSLVTPEDTPLALFGRQASAAVESLLSEAGVAIVTGVYPAVVEKDALTLTPRGRIAADAVVSLPRLEGPGLPGLPHDPAGFIPTDRHGRVEGVDSVYAAGDVTTFPVKQGGLATQQADAVAEAIAAEAGADVEPSPFKPVLRGLLLTGGPPSYLRADLRGGQGETSRAEVDPLWWPPSKVAGKHLSHYLVPLVAAERPTTGAIRVEIDDFEPLLRS
jgi:sulfide:quinone oxidoreductase